MKKLIGVTNITSEYSNTARTLWREIHGLGLGFDFMHPPKKGLIEALAALRRDGTITHFSYEPQTETQPYFYVSFEVPMPTTDSPPRMVSLRYLGR